MSRKNYRLMSPQFVIIFTTGEPLETPEVAHIFFQDFYKYRWRRRGYHYRPNEEEKQMVTQFVALVLKYPDIWQKVAMNNGTSKVITRVFYTQLSGLALEKPEEVLVTFAWNFVRNRS